MRLQMDDTTVYVEIDGCPSKYRRKLSLCEVAPKYGRCPQLAGDDALPALPLTVSLLLANRIFTSFAMRRRWDDTTA
jgi:hypothetical protein